MRQLLSLLVVLGLASSCNAQKPQSPKAEAKSAHISISYGQPSVRGRVIFGQLVPYGQVWRTGANEATEITFKKDASFGGKKVKAGTYTLFTIPGEKEWTIILNSVLKQWGAFGYDKVKDKNVLETTVPSTKLSTVVEQFTISIPSSENAVLLQWDKTSVSIPVSF